MQKAHRIEAGQAYCQSCYARLFEHVRCSNCGKTCVTKKFDPRPLCRACTIAERRCVRCGRPVPRAGIRVGAGVVCPSCAPHYREKRPCSECGALSAQLTRIEGAGEPICPRCARKTTHATCAACGKHRRIGAVKSNGRLICVSCAAPEPARHTCPDCGTTIPGSGSAPCRTCGARRRGRAAVAAAAPAIGWPRELFERYCEECLIVSAKGRIVPDVEKAATFFRALSRKILSEDRLDGISLHRAFGAEALRRAQHAVAFLTETTNSEITEAERRALVEEDRIERIFREVEQRPWASDLKGYDTSLRARLPVIAVRSRRLYIRAAVGLLDASGCLRLKDVDQASLDAFLRRRPGQRSSLAPLLKWVADWPGIHLKLPPGRKTKAETNEKAILADVARIMSDLETVQHKSRARALIALAISRLYRVPLERVLTLSGKDVIIGDDICLWPNGEAIRLERPLTDAFQRWISASGNRLAFPGRNTRRPISVSAIAHAERLEEMSATERRAPPHRQTSLPRFLPG